MTGFLIRRFIRNPEDTENAEVRYAYGRLAGITGLCANVLLFAAKLVAGGLTGSLAIMADAFNNLSDAGSSIVTLVGFKLSSAPPDEEHPFGHGRMEYLSALAVAALIMVAGFELATKSVEKILHPSETAFEPVSLVILVLAIGVKLWMALFYRKIGGRIDSEVLRAASADSRNDTLSTLVVLVSAVVNIFVPVDIDGYVGAVIALFVIWSGFSVIRKTVSPLLGQAPDPKFVEDIKNTVLSYDGIIGIHDLMVHNYGPGRVVLSLHAEVPAEEDVMHSHDLVDRVEKELMQKYHAIACIHMDPVNTSDERVARLREMVEGLLHGIDERLSLHDFRVVFGDTHTNLIFDLVVPYDYPDGQQLCADIRRLVAEKDPTLCTVATVEHSFT